MVTVRTFVLFCAAASVVATAAHAEGRPAERYLVAPFQNQSPVRALDWMSSALATTVAEKLEAVPSLAPAYGASILEGMPRSFDAARVAARASEAPARWVIGGAFARPSWKAQVTVRLYQVKDEGAPALELVRSATATGERDALLGLLDQALLEVARAQGWLPDGDAGAETLAAMKRAPTRDLYAFTLYGRALNLFYGIAIPTDEAASLKLLERVVHIDPKFAEAHRTLGLVHLARGELARAAGQYAYALDLRPRYFAALDGLARLYRAEGKRAQAEEAASKALELRPSDDELRFLLGQLQSEGGELDAALANLLRVISDQPRHLPARRALVQVYAAKGEVEALAAELGEVAQLAPDDISVRLDLGAAFMRLGRPERAIAAFEEVLRRQPRHAQALKFVGDCHRRLGDPASAIAAYERMRHLLPSDPRPYFLLGTAYAEAGRNDRAEAVLQEAQQFTRYLGEAWIDLGAIALRKGDLSTASWYLQRAVVKAPTRPKGHFNYALVLAETNRRDQALAEVRTAAELDPDDAEIPYLEGVIALRLGRFEEARLAFQSALKLRPEHPDARHNLALLDDLDRRYGTEHAARGAQ